jgi:hypothetical protein
MRKTGLIALALLLMLSAQEPAQVPTINPLGIVRADTTRPGMLSPGIVFSIWGHNYGPKEGCHGSAKELCGVQVLLDGAPIEVQYTTDILINARMPEDTPAKPMSQIVVVSGGRHSAPADVRRAPERAVISLDGIARVDGPVWIHVELPKGQGASYPAWSIPNDFACVAFEVRKDGKPLARVPYKRGGMAYSGGSCPGLIALNNTDGKLSRLPLHLQYSFNEPGTYEVRLSHYGDFTRHSEDMRSQSPWTPIEVLAASPSPSPVIHPQAPAGVVSQFLPDLLAHRDDQTLRILFEYLYSAGPRVRAYAGAALGYWADAEIEPVALESLKATGPSSATLPRLQNHPAELAQAAIDHLFSDDPALLDGAIGAANVAIHSAIAFDSSLRTQLEQKLLQFASGDMGRADAQATTNVISILGGIQTPAAHNLLWTLVGRHTGVQQALIAICWHKNPEDIPRLTEYILAAPGDDDSVREVQNLPYALRNSFGDAALPALRTVLEKATALSLRVNCAAELMRAGDPAGFAFALDAIEANRNWKLQMRGMVANQFPDTRNMTDPQLAEFLRRRAR